MVVGVLCCREWSNDNLGGTYTNSYLFVLTVPDETSLDGLFSLVGYP